MARTIESVIHNGVLLGNGLKAECRVRVEEMSFCNLQGFKFDLQYGKHEIVTWGEDLPDGFYQLTVHGVVLWLGLHDGRWAQATAPRVG